MLTEAGSCSSSEYMTPIEAALATYTSSLKEDLVEGGYHSPYHFLSRLGCLILLIDLHSSHSQEKTVRLQCRSG